MNSPKFSVFMLALLLSLPIAVQATDAGTLKLQAISRPGKGEARVPEVSWRKSGTYIIEFHSPPLAQYSGGIRNLPPTSPAATGDARLDANSTAARSYLSHLSAEQSRGLLAIQRATGNFRQPEARLTHAFNGVVMKLSAEEAERISRLPEVKRLVLDEIRQLHTDSGPAFIGAPEIWTGGAGNGTGNKGEGMVVGILDTGINFDHPSFAATGDDGYTHVNPLGEGNYLGVCNPADPGYDPAFECNSKLIGAWSFMKALGDAISPEDDDGHGSHVASTAAGNVLNSAGEFGVPVSGVAPHANIIAFDVCDTDGCPTSALLQAMEMVVKSAPVIDVINYSISGGANPYTDPVETAFLSATHAGILVSASAGNDGPLVSTVAHHGPWTMTVAATTHDRAGFGNRITLASGAAVPAELADLGGQRAADAPVPADDVVGQLVYADDVDGDGVADGTNAEGCNAYDADALAGRIALVQRGTCGFIDKVNNAAAAGAIGVLVFNNGHGPLVNMAVDGSTILSWFLTKAQGDILRDFVLANPGDVEATVSLLDYATMVVDGLEDRIADFSSRGPALGSENLLKPDLAAPGVNILAAVNTVNPESGPEFGLISGTSMASPHAAGAATLVREVHPEWTPAEVKSALMTTATRAISQDDNLDNVAVPATPFDIGSGRIQVDQAIRAGLTMNVSHAEYLAVAPEHGGRYHELNLPSAAFAYCGGSCSWTRTVTNRLDTTVSYEVSVEAPAGLAIAVSPTSFTLAPGESQVLEFTNDVSALPIGEWVFGTIILASEDEHPWGGDIPPQHLTLAVRPSEQAPQIGVSPNSIQREVAFGNGVEASVRIQNLGDLPLNYTVGAPGDGVTLEGATLRTQPVSGNSGIYQGYYDADSVSIGGAIDFEAWGTTTLSRVYAPGFMVGNTIDDLAAYADSVYVAIHEDAGGQPAAAPFWETTLAFGPQVSGANGNIDIRFEAAEAPTLPAGTWWLIVQPEFSTDFDTGVAWLWFQADQAGRYPGLFRDYSNYFGIAAYGWVDLYWLLGNASFRDFAARIEGSSACEGTADWLSVPDGAGTVAVNEHADVGVLLDSAGLAAGTYTAPLCVSSNAAEPADRLIEVSMTVREAKAGLSLSASSVSATLPANGSGMVNLVLSNSGEMDTDFEFSESEGETLDLVSADTTLFAQPWDTSSGYWNSNFPGIAVVAAFDDFVMSSAGSVLRGARVEGFYLGAVGPEDVLSARFELRADDGGTPAGSYGDPTGLIASCEVTNGDPGLEVSDEYLAIDLVAAGCSTHDIVPGTRYWVSLVPTFNPIGDNTELAGSGFLYGSANATATAPSAFVWDSDAAAWLEAILPSGSGMAFEVIGGTLCEATDIGFLELSPYEGSVAAGGSAMVGFEFTAGAIPGTQINAVCLSSTSRDASILHVPVRLQVIEPLALSDAHGDPLDATPVATGGALAFRVGGGSGVYSFDARHLGSGMEAMVTGPVAGVYVFRAPTTGAFAGTYRVTVTDNISGIVSELDVVVPPSITVEYDWLLSGVDNALVTVRGTEPGTTIAFRVLDEGGTHDAGGNIASIDATAVSTDDSEDGNPATALLAAATVDKDEPVTVEATAAGYADALAELSIEEAITYSGTVKNATTHEVIEGVQVLVKLVKDPAGQPYIAYTDADGWFELVARAPDEGAPADTLVMSAPTYQLKHAAGDGCLSNPGGCVVTMIGAEAHISGVIKGLQKDEIAEVYTYYTGPSGEVEVGPAAFEGKGGPTAFILGLDHSLQYDRLFVDAFGYLDVTDDNGGAGFDLRGGDIGGVVIELEARTPVVTTKPASEVGKTGATLNAEVDPNERAVTVRFRYGTSADDLGETVSAGTLAATASTSTVSKALTGLECGTGYVAVIEAETDLGDVVSGEPVEFETSACETGGNDGGNNGGGGKKRGGGAPGGVLLGLLGLAALLRRKRG